MSGISKIKGRLKAWAAGNTHYGHQAATDTLEIITAYEQSQKANAELLAALKKARKEIMYYSDLRPDDSIIKRIDRALNKHKGE